MTSETQDDAVKTLAEVGFEIVQAFGRISQGWAEADDNKGLELESFVNEEERFQLWATHLGLHQRGHASLDYRFRDAENLYEYARKVLVDLLNALNSIYDDLFNQNDSPEQDVHEEDNSNEEEEWPESDEDDSLDGFGDETVAQAAFKSVLDSIDRLFKLAMKVRNPATRTGFSRAYQHEQIDEDSGEGLFNSFERRGVDKEHIQHLLHLWQGPKNTDISKQSFLTDRLAQANSKRRRQFAYWSHHKLNQIRRTEKAKQKLSQIIGQPHRPSSALAPSASAHSKPTTATHLDHTKIDLDDNRSVYSTMSLMLPEVTGDNDALEMPPVPERYLSQEDLKEFECPYCFTICSQRLLQKREWKAHILKDLRPYVCTFESCNEATQLYDSYTDWANHEIQAHGLLDSMQQGNQDQSQRHLHEEEKQDHPSSAGASGRASRRCPFCFDQLDGIEKIQRHIAHHLIRVALFTIPRSTGIEVEDQDKPGGSDQNALSMASGNSVANSRTASLVSSFDSQPPSPLPEVTATATPLDDPDSSIEKLRDLQKSFQSDWLPLCNRFVSDPPLGATDRKNEYLSLSEDIKTHITLKADAIALPDGAEARITRRALDIMVEATMRRLEAVARASTINQSRTPSLHSANEEVLAGDSSVALPSDNPSSVEASTDAPLPSDHHDPSSKMLHVPKSPGSSSDGPTSIDEPPLDTAQDWAITDVPPGYLRAQMDAEDRGAQELTWQRYNGVRRSKYFPAHGDTDDQDGDRRKTPEGPWTEITKDLVVKKAIEEKGYAYEETERFYYILAYLKYEDIVPLVERSEEIRKDHKAKERALNVPLIIENPKQDVYTAPPRGQDYIFPDPDTYDSLQKRPSSFFSRRNNFAESFTSSVLTTESSRRPLGENGKDPNVDAQHDSTDAAGDILILAERGRSLEGSQPEQDLVEEAGKVLSTASGQEDPVIASQAQDDGQRSAPTMNSSIASPKSDDEDPTLRSPVQQQTRRKRYPSPVDSPLDAPLIPDKPGSTFPGQSRIRPPAERNEDDHPASLPSGNHITSEPDFNDIAGIGEGVDDPDAPDVILVRRMANLIRIEFPPFSISDGIALVGELRESVADRLQLDPGRLRLVYKLQRLTRNSWPLKKYNVKQNSEVLVIITEETRDYDQDHSDSSTSDEDFVYEDDPPRSAANTRRRVFGILPNPLPPKPPLANAKWHQHFSTLGHPDVAQDTTSNDSPRPQGNVNSPPATDEVQNLREFRT